MKILFEEGSVVRTTGFTVIDESNEKIEGLIIESITYVGGQETTDIEIEVSSSSRDLTLKEEQKLLNAYNAYAYKED
jgi:hypothetical protein